MSLIYVRKKRYNVYLIYDKISKKLYIEPSIDRLLESTSLKD